MAKEKQTRRMIAMALAAAVTVTAVPADALAASDYSSKVSRMQERNAARKAALDQKLHREPIELVVEIPAEAPVEAIAETPADPVENAMQNTPLQSEEILNQDMVDVTVQIPDTDVDDPATEDVENQNSETFGEVAGTETVAGNPPADANDKEYDFTVETTVQQGQVTIETTEMLVKENVAAGDTDMDYISSEETPSATNDLLKEVPSAAPEDVSDLIADAEDDAYEYIYAGTGNTSQLRPAVVFTEPMTDEEKLARWGDHAYIGKSYSELWVGHLEDPDIAARDENGKLILVDGFVVDKDGNRILKEEFSVVGPDGKKYYTQRIDNPGEGIFVEGWYSDGEWHAELNAPADTDENGNPVLKKVQLLNQDGTPVLDENNAPIFVEVGKMNEFANKYENGVIVHSGGYGKVLKDQDGNVMVNYLAVWASTQQFVLVDKTTGEVITTYCVDISTATQDSFGYNVENLEDADYYNEEQAEKIRSIALKGY
ncbi:MAG: hypothetical protein IJE27_03955 [Anaerotignum sp.]|nr:hypothetical protein [Anaerotignum sp.]